MLPRAGAYPVAVTSGEPQDPDAATPLQEGLRVLHVASMQGHHAVVQVLLSKGASVDTGDAYGDTPLHYACFCGHVKAVRALINAGANPHKKSADPKSLLQS